MKKEEYNNYLIELVDLIKKGDTDAMLKIIDALRPLIYKHGAEIAKRYGRDKDECFEEHFQNLYIEIYYCALRFDLSMKSRFIGYAIICIRNYFYKNNDKSKKIETHENSLDEEAFDNGDGEKAALIDILTDETALSVEEQMCNKEMSVYLKSALNTLEPIQKKFVYLSYVEGLKLKEIEKKLCMSTHRVRKLRDKTLKQLKEFKAIQKIF